MEVKIALISLSKVATYKIVQVRKNWAAYPKVSRIHSSEFSLIRYPIRTSLVCLFFFCQNYLAVKFMKNWNWRNHAVSNQFCIIPTSSWFWTFCSSFQWTVNYLNGQTAANLVDQGKKTRFVEVQAANVGQNCTDQLIQSCSPENCPGLY